MGRNRESEASRPSGTLRSDVWDECGPFNKWGSNNIQTPCEKNHTPCEKNHTLDALRNGFRFFLSDKFLENIVVVERCKVGTLDEHTMCYFRSYLDRVSERSEKKENVSEGFTLEISREQHNLLVSLVYRSQ